MTRSISVLIGVFLNVSLIAQPLEVSLKEAVQIALDSSYAVRDAQYNIEKKKKEVQEVMSIGFPQVNGKAELQDFLDIPVSLVPAQFFNPDAVEGEFAEIQFGVKYNLTASITASQLIFDGTYFVGLAAAKTVVELSRLQEKKTEQEIRIATADAYYSVLLAEENLRILEDNVANLSKTLKETQALYQNGLTEEQDVDQLQLNLNKLEISRDNTRQFLSIAKQSLLFIMGLPIDREIVLSDSIEALVELSTDVAYLERSPEINTHPDIMLAKTNVEIQKLQIKGDKAAFIPSLSGFFTHQQVGQRNEFNFGDAGEPWFPTTIIGLTLNVPIWSSFQRRAQLQQSQIGLKQSELQLQQAQEGLLLEIEQARSNYSTALKNYENQKKSFELAQRINRKTTIKYSEGVADSFALNVTENQLLQEQSKYIQSALDLLNAKQALDKALNIF